MRDGRGLTLVPFLSEHKGNKEAAMPKPVTLDALRRTIATLEAGEGEGTALSLGIAALDGVLAGRGLKCGALHEVAPVTAARDHDGAALGFAAHLLGGLAGLHGRPALWLSGGETPYAPGLAGFGLGPDRLIFCRAQGKAQLWALEEAVRSPALGGVLAEIHGMDFTAARRLHLAARASGTTLLLVNRASQAVSAAATRWRVGGLAGADGRWRLDLVRCRGRAPDESGLVARWEVEWNGTTGRLGLVAQTGHGSVAPDRHADAA
jgi:protein ImuA